MLCVNFCNRELTFALVLPLGLRAPILQAIQNKGYKQPTPIQRKGICSQYLDLTTESKTLVPSSHSYRTQWF